MNAADGVGLILLSAAIPYCHFNGYRRSGWIGAWAFSIAVGSHVVLNILSAAEIALAPRADNLGFHLKAVSYALGDYFQFNGPTSNLWPYAISYIYAALGSSIWLGYAINQWIYVLFLVQFLKLCREIGVGRYQWFGVVGFSLLPSSLLYANFLLREPLQLLCLVIAIRGMEKFRRLGRVQSLIMTAAALVPFGAVHSGFFLFAPIALVGAILARLFLSPKAQQVRRFPGGWLAGLVFGLALVAASVMVVGSYSEHRRVTQVIEGDIDIAESIQATAALGGRTAFAWTPPVVGLGGLIYSPIHLFQFLFAPLVPFMIRTPDDLVAAFDTAARLLALFGTLLLYRRADVDNKRMILFLIGTYLVFCLIASLGTQTVGTALRHHLKVFWITIALGLPGLMGGIARRPRAPYSSASTLGPRGISSPRPRQAQLYARPRHVNRTWIGKGPGS